jgi:hypothetical protein
VWFLSGRGNSRLGKLHSEELNYFYFSPNICRMIKLRRMRWVGHVARVVKKIIWKTLA